MTFVSIIIPAYNEETTIGATLASLMRQTYRNFEIIVVDNNSTDKTSEIARQYVGKIFQEKKPGYHNAVKKGAELAKGNIITMCDADTLYPPNWLQLAVKAFAKNDRIVAVYGPAFYHDGSFFIKTVGAASFWLVCLASHLMGVPITSGFNFLMRKEAYETVGGYDPKIYNMIGLDIELGQRLKMLGVLKLLPFNLPFTSTRRLEKASLFYFLKTSAAAWYSFYTKKPQLITYNSYNLKS